MIGNLLGVSPDSLMLIIRLLLIPLLSTATLTDTYERLEQLNRIPEGWSVSGTPNPAQVIRLRLALTQQNVAKFEQTLMDVSTPDHLAYGKHLSKNAVKAMLRPTDKAIDGVLKWLKKHDVDDLLHDNDWIHFNITINKAEEMLDTRFKVYSDDFNGIERIRTLGYSVPSKIRGYIDMIQPTTRFSQIRPQRSTILVHKHLRKADRFSKWTNKAAFDLSQCNVEDSFEVPNFPTVTIECLRHLYKLGTPSSKMAKCGSKLGIAGYLEQYAKFADLETMLNEYAPYAVDSNFTISLINGGKNDQVVNASINSYEANLDVQMAVPLAFPVPVEYYSTGGRGPVIYDLIQPSGNSDEPYLEFLTYMLALPDGELPQTLTTSYGEDEQNVPAIYARTICNMLAQLGARGVSILFSSGDFGPGAGCQTNDGSNTTRFLPAYPSSCPFVTAVGATVGVLPEKAAALSGGGFSDFWPRPAYQDDAVKKYLKKLGTQWEGLYNPKGRAYPDVAAQGMHLQIIDSGLETWISGTSAASPIFASVIALLNDGLMAKGRPPLGFLNPWLYSSGKAGLVDIINGGSKGCKGPADTFQVLPFATWNVDWPVIPFASWNATVGWDPATGLGTPDYKKMSKLLGLSF